MGITSSHQAAGSASAGSAIESHASAHGTASGYAAQSGAASQRHVATHAHSHAPEGEASAALLPEPPLASIVAQMRSELFGVAPKDVLVGSEVVDWMMSQLWCSSRQRGTALGQALLSAGALTTVGHDAGFRDAYLFYKFADEATAEDSATHEFDIAIIGGGIAGLYAAQFAARIGARVALIEKSRVGGESTWTRGVPFTALATIARSAHETRTSASRGVHVSGPVRVDMNLVRSQVQRVIHEVYAEHSPAALAKAGVEVIMGAACFADAGTLEVTLNDEDPVMHALVASGRAASTRHAPSPAPSDAGSRQVSPPASKLDDGGAASIFEPGHSGSLDAIRPAGVPPAPPPRNRTGSSVARPASSAAPPKDATRIGGASATPSPAADATSSGSSLVPPLRGMASHASASIHHTVSGRRRVRVVKATRFVLATGTCPRIPSDIEGLTSVPYYTFETIVDNTFLPRRLIVIGGSASGCEIAQAYSRLGSEVTIIAPALLPKESDAVRDVLRRVFYKERIVHVAASVTRVEKTDAPAVPSPYMMTTAQGTAGPSPPISGRTSPVAPVTSTTSVAKHTDGQARAHSGFHAPTKTSSPVLSAQPTGSNSPASPILSSMGTPAPAAVAPPLSLHNSTSAHHSSGRASITSRGSFTARTGESALLAAPIIVHAGDDVFLADMIFVAVGHVPMLDTLGLKNAGVELAPEGRGVKANAQLQTSAKHIFAAGDIVAGSERAPHYAAFQGYHAARNALMPGSVPGVSDVLPRVAFTDPEVASVGLTFAEAAARYGADRVRVLHRDNEDVDRARASFDNHGFMSLVVLRDGSIVGATIVNACAGEMISEITLAMTNKIKVQDLAPSIHPYPTYSAALQQLASTFSSDTFAQSTIGRVVSSLYALKPAAAPGVANRSFVSARERKQSDASRSAASADTPAAHSPQ